MNSIVSLQYMLANYIMILLTFYGKFVLKCQTQLFIGKELLTQ